MDLRTQDIKFLSGVGNKKAEVLKADAKIFSYEDLLYYFPYKHIDRSKFYSVRELRGNMPYVQLHGQIRNFKTIGEGRKKRLTDGNKKTNKQTNIIVIEIVHLAIFSSVIVLNIIFSIWTKTD